jgi:hypothetical protein
LCDKCGGCVFDIPLTPQSNVERVTPGLTHPTEDSDGGSESIKYSCPASSGSNGKQNFGVCVLT